MKSLIDRMSDIVQNKLKSKKRSVRGRPRNSAVKLTDKMRCEWEAKATICYKRKTSSSGFTSCKNFASNAFERTTVPSNWIIIYDGTPLQLSCCSGKLGFKVVSHLMDGEVSFESALIIIPA